jgi:hypothetical protein
MSIAFPTLAGADLRSRHEMSWCIDRSPSPVRVAARGAVDRDLPLRDPCSRVRGTGSWIYLR